MAEPTSHPSARELAAFGVGGLSSEQASRIAHHLADCTECRRAPGEHRPSETPLLSTGTTPSAAGSYVPPELSSSGKYEVLEKLGEGGMGSVWKAKHAFLDCLVAIKVMNAAAVGQPDARERFLREMRAAGRLQHPRIVRAFDAERAGDVLLLVLEYVEGVTLERLVAKKGPVPISYGCRWVVEAAEGLQHAHEQGLVHRDIKPANLMLTAKTKEVKILDFGLARLSRDQGGGQTQFQTFMGTPEYVAPEQANDARSADIRADVYSLGCTLYFLLTGSPPFKGSSVMETLVAHLQEPARPLIEVRPDVPARLSAVVAKMLAKSPKDRYQTPAAVLAALRPFASGSRKGKPIVEVKSVKPAAEAPRIRAIEVVEPHEPTRKPSATRVATPMPRRRERGGRDTEDGNWRAWIWAAAIVVGLLAMPALVWIVLLGLEGGIKGKASANKENEDAMALPERGPLTPEFTNAVGMRMVLLPAGIFVMGSLETEQDRTVEEGPRHEVLITRPFYLGAFEVTQQQYEKVMENNPSYFRAGGLNGARVAGLDTGQFPVENVSWEDAVEFCRKLSALPEEKRAKRGYRLPTEAEWEYGCRAGTTGPFHFGDSLSSSQANFDGSVPYGGGQKWPNLQRLVPVGSYPKNAYGLYDMHGNVWEWCSDWFDPDYYATRPRSAPPGPMQGTSRVNRGGSWLDFGNHLRSAHRGRNDANYKKDNVGFRVALVPFGG